TLPPPPRSPPFPYTTLFRSALRRCTLTATMARSAALRRAPIPLTQPHSRCAFRFSKAARSRQTSSRRTQSLLNVRLSLRTFADRSEEHTSELQSRGHLVCRL